MDAKRQESIPWSSGMASPTEDTGVTTQGPSRDAALANLDEAVALHHGEIGREPTDEDRRRLGIDPADDPTGEQEPHSQDRILRPC